MEIREEQLIRSLMETDSELRYRYHEHLELKRRSEELKHQQFLQEKYLCFFQSVRKNCA